MKKSIGLWQLVGFAFTSLFGTLLHFLYDWVGSDLVAPFSAVNESTWEHMKLLFFPLFVFAIIEYFFWGKENDIFWCVKLRGTLLGLIMIPVLFYTYNGVLGKSPDWVNISIFFVSAAITYIWETRKFNKDNMICKKPYLSFAALCVIALLFVVFTFLTPKIPIFRDPITMLYGK